MPIKPKPYEPPARGDGPTAVDEAVAKALGDHADPTEALERVAGVWRVIGSSTTAYWPY